MVKLDLQPIEDNSNLDLEAIEEPEKLNLGPIPTKSSSKIAKPLTFGDKLMNAGKDIISDIPPKWNKERGRLDPDSMLGLAPFANAALDAKDMTLGSAVLGGMALKNIFVNLPSENYKRIKAGKPLVGATTEDWKYAGQKTKEFAKQAGKAIAEPYTSFEAAKSYPLQVALDFASLGSLRGIPELLAKTGRTAEKSVASDLGKLIARPQQYVREITEKPIGEYANPEGNKVLTTGLDLTEIPKEVAKPSINELAEKKPLTLKQFSKIRNEVLNEFTPAERKLYRNPKKYNEFYQEYLKRYDSGDAKAHATTQQYFQKYGQKLPKVENVQDNLGKIEPTTATSEEIFNDIKQNDISSKKPLFSPKEIQDRIGKIYNRHTVDKQTKFSEIEENIQKITEGLNDSEKQQLVNYLQDPISYKINEPISLKGDELGNWGDIRQLTKEKLKEFRQIAQKYYQKNIQGKSVNHSELGKINFYRVGGDEVISKVPHNAKIFPVLLKAVETSKLIGEELPKHPRKDGIVKFHNLTNQISLGEKLENHNFKVAEDSFGNKFYFIKDTPESFNLPNGKGALKGDNNIIADENTIFNPNEISPKIKSVADVINKLTQESTDFLTKGGYISEQTAKENPYRQAIVSRWVKNNLKDLTPNEIKKMADAGMIETYAGVKPENIVEIIKEYENSGQKPTYLNVNYQKNIMQAFQDWLAGNKDPLDSEQAVEILNKRKLGVSPKINIEKSLNTLQKNIATLEANKSIVDTVHNDFAMPLEEFGKVKKGYTVWTPELLQKKIVESYTNPEDVIRTYLGTDPQDLYREATKEGLPIYQIPESAVKRLSQYYYKPEGVEKALQDANRPFKRYALSSGRFITNNLFNNAINNLVEGVPVSAYAKALDPELIKGAPPELRNSGFYGSEKNSAIPLVEKGLNAVTNKILPFKQTKNLTTKVIDGIFNINQNFENTIFRSNYFKQLSDIAKETGSKFEDLLNNPTVQEEALDRTYRSLGNYSDKNPMYNTPLKYKGKDTISLSSAIPFIRPMVEQAKVTRYQMGAKALPFNAYIAKPGQIGTDIADKQVDEFQALGRPLKDYQKRSLYQDYYLDENNNLVYEPDIRQVPDIAKPVMYNYSSLVPHSIVGEFLEDTSDKDILGLASRLNPYFNMIRATMSGSKFGGYPVSSPEVGFDWPNRIVTDNKGNPVLDESGKQKILPGTDIPNDEKIKLLISELLRTATPLGNIEKYLPYKSYDTQIFNPNPYARPRTPFYYASKLLGGSESVAPKVKGHK